VGLLDLTKGSSLDWFRGRLSYLLKMLHTEGGKREEKEDILFFLDSGNAHHTPTYFEAGGKLG
jgi:hypothetical protein